MATKKPAQKQKTPTPIDMIKKGVNGYKKLLNAFDVKKLKK